MNGQIPVAPCIFTAGIGITQGGPPNFRCRLPERDIIREGEVTTNGLRVKRVHRSARIEGQLGTVGLRESGNTADVFTDYFVPDGEERTIISLPRAARKRYAAFRRAIGLLRDLAA